MESRTRSEDETGSKEPAPLIELVEKPKTQTSPELQKPKPLEIISTDIEDSSVLDLSVYKPSKFSTSQPLVLVHIRPFKEDIDNLLKVGEEKISYIFRGRTPAYIKAEFEKALGELKPKSCTELRKEVFQYEYHIAQEKAVYDSAKHLNKTLCN